MNNDKAPSKNNFVHYLIFFSGLAALSWEIIWQIKASLALGVSSTGTAITLAVTMGGMALGALLMGVILKNGNNTKPLRIYGFLEIIIGLAGLSLVSSFQMIEDFDTWAYQNLSFKSEFIFLSGIATILGIPALCLGATLPVIGLISKQTNVNISALYGLNTLGAATGCLLAAFLFIPTLGVQNTIFCVAAINMCVGLIAILAGSKTTGAATITNPIQKTQHNISFLTCIVLVCLTGFSTFVLEVAWFRSLTAAFLSTTDAFAIMLAAVLLALGLGARIIPLIKLKNISLYSVIAWAGILVLLVTPIIERFDYLTGTVHSQPIVLFTYWFMLTLYVIGPPILLLGVALPWILDQESSPQKWGLLYGLNALFAIIGALCAAWVLLPTIGFARTSWLIGGMLIITGIILSDHKKRVPAFTIGIIALAIAIVFESGVGRDRVQGNFTRTEHVGKETEIVAFREGVDATISVVSYKDHKDVRLLIIDGFETTTEGLDDSYHYMEWMGHLPMISHPDPKRALVICFGTGQTAHAVRKEAPDALDIVDLNKDVFELAEYFPVNKSVLKDPIVTPIVMDGRSYIRRTDKLYDVITLEPMPPNFAGVNALYSKEFYEASKTKMTDNGVIAQWVPFHILSIKASLSIAKTFQSVFPNSIMWIDPVSNTGILLGSKDITKDISSDFPGYQRQSLKNVRDLSADEVKQASELTPKLLEKYAEKGQIIDDNNQILAYGKMLYSFHKKENLGKNNLNYLDKFILENKY